MTPEDAEEYTQALGQVVSGGYRAIALGIKLGVSKSLGLSDDEWVRTKLGGVVRLSIPERRNAAKELADEGFSQRQIGASLGVSHTTVDRDLGGTNVPEDDGVRAQEPAVGGTNVPSDSPPLLSVVDLETGEIVATADEYLEEQRQEEAESASLIAAVPDPSGTAELWRLRQMVARGLSQFSSNVLVLDPVAASEACDDGQRRDMKHFRKQVDEWIAAFERADARGLRAVR
jgi:hypothetical protein